MRSAQEIKKIYYDSVYKNIDESFKKLEKEIEDKLIVYGYCGLVARNNISKQVVAEINLTEFFRFNMTFIFDTTYDLTNEEDYARMKFQSFIENCKKLGYFVYSYDKSVYISVLVG